MVTIDVENEYENEQEIYISHYNESTKQLEDEQLVTVANGYITLELEHLSTYVLSTETSKVAETPSENENTEVNDIEGETLVSPQTGDTIFTVCGILLVAIIAGRVYSLKKNNSKH